MGRVSRREFLTSYWNATPVGDIGNNKTTLCAPPGTSKELQQFADECSGSDTLQSLIEPAKVRPPRQRLLNLAVGLWSLRNKCNQAIQRRGRPACGAPERRVPGAGADTQVCPYCGCTIYSKTINPRLNSRRRYAAKTDGQNQQINRQQKAITHTAKRSSDQPSSPAAPVSSRPGATLPATTGRLRRMSADRPASLHKAGSRGSASARARRPNRSLCRRLPAPFPGR